MANLDLACHRHEGKEPNSMVESTVPSDSASKPLKRKRKSGANDDNEHHKLIKLDVEEPNITPVTEHASSHNLHGKQATLETLPTEILEVITWYSMNPAMVIVSKSINHKLSNINSLQADMATSLFSRCFLSHSASSLALFTSSVAKSHPPFTPTDENSPWPQGSLRAKLCFQWRQLQNSADLIYTAWLRCDCNVEGTNLQLRCDIQAILDEHFNILTLCVSECESEDGFHMLGFRCDGAVWISCVNHPCTNPECTRRRLLGRLSDFTFTPLRLLRLASGIEEEPPPAFNFQTSSHAEGGALLWSVNIHDGYRKSIADAARRLNILAACIPLAILETEMNNNTIDGPTFSEIESDGAEVMLEAKHEAMAHRRRQMINFAF